MNEEIRWDGELESERRKRKEEQVRVPVFNFSLSFFFCYQKKGARAPLGTAASQANEGAGRAHGQPVRLVLLCQNSPVRGAVRALCSCFLLSLSLCLPPHALFTSSSFLSLFLVSPPLARFTHSSLRGNPNLELFGFDVRIGGQTLIENANLHVAQGHRYGLVGKNGVGKTSACSAIPYFHSLSFLCACMHVCVCIFFAENAPSAGSHVAPACQPGYLGYPGDHADSSCGARGCCVPPPVFFMCSSSIFLCLTCPLLSLSPDSRRRHYSPRKRLVL